MYKYKTSKNSVDWICCPMGTLKNGVVDCYYFGVVKISECNGCTVRKDNKIVRKGD